MSSDCSDSNNSSDSSDSCDHKKSKIEHGDKNK